MRKFKCVCDKERNRGRHQVSAMNDRLRHREDFVHNPARIFIPNL
jgi:hypothetical protein